MPSIPSFHTHFSLWTSSPSFHSHARRTHFSMFHIHQTHDSHQCHLHPPSFHTQLNPFSWNHGKGRRDMGFLTNRVERSRIRPGDPIYIWRAVFIYSHHGIFVGGSKVVHFTPERNRDSKHGTPSDSYDLMSGIASSCSTFPDCGFRQPNRGVVLSCLDCFLGKGSPYSFEYGATPSVFLAKVRGGTCTTATPDPPDAVIHRAMYLLQNGFGNYDVFQNNCEGFALYSKAGPSIVDKSGVGRSGQASFVTGAPLAAVLSSPLKLLMPNPVDVARVTAGMYCMSRYVADIGVRTDVIKVAVENLAVNLGCGDGTEEEAEDIDASNRQIVRS